MTKTEALALFEGDFKRLARAMGITRSAAYQWPEELSQEVSDRVLGAWYRTVKPTAIGEER